MFDHIVTYHPLSDEAKEAISDCFRQVTLAKNDHLVSKDRICRQLFFLETGCLRGYYHLEDKEITHWFGFEHDFVTSFYSFITQQPALENIQAIEGCILWGISIQDLNGLMDQYHEVERLVRKAYERYYLRLEERFVNAQFKSATERYEQLMSQSPHLLERVPLGYIASYLGISQETLSRIRSRL